MKLPRSILTAALCAAATAFPGAASATNRIELVFSGVPEANTAAWPNTPAFTSWCAGTCHPTTQIPLYDAATGQKKGSAYVWGSPFAFGANGSLCFSEFIVFALDEGDIYVHSPNNGTCGAPLDPSLKQPGPGASVVLAGGGDGAVYGGTRKYRNWTGSYTDRVFVGFGNGGVGGIIYYDQLWFSISATDAAGGGN